MTREGIEKEIIKLQGLLELTDDELQELEDANREGLSDVEYDKYMVW